MTTSTQLVTGLGGAIGCDYLRSHGQLIFVEFDGKISRINMVRSPVSTVSSGEAILHGDHGFDLDTGSELDESDEPAYSKGIDIKWLAEPDNVLGPKDVARMALIGEVNFDDVSAAELQGLSYAEEVGLELEPFEGDGGPVFAVITRSGNYAKVQVTECSAGYDLRIRWVTYSLGHRYEVLGTGYEKPEDVVVSADGQHAYVTERSGNLLRVDLTNADRTQATVVSTGMSAPHQIALDESRGHAYVVEFANPGRLLRIDLTTGAQTVLYGNLENAIGLLMTDDLRFAYVSEQASGGDGQLSHIALSTGQREVLVTGLTNPFFLTWADPGEGAILTTERDPANQVSLIDLTQTPVSVSQVATGVPFRPSSVAVMAPDRLLLCSDSVVSELNLTDYVATGPILLGIGHVPFDRINVNDGYADTTVDPGYFFQVKHAPFGGTLPLMVNHEGAYADGARYYKVLVDGVAQQQSWSDYRWSTSTNRFELHTMNPIDGEWFEVRPPHELWYNHWLGYRLNTYGLAPNLYAIEVELYEAPDASSLIRTGRIGILEVQIDNRWPIAVIDEIIHDGVVVDTCAIVDTGSSEFTFRITARDAEGHLKSWHLGALWGDNKSKPVDWDSYPPTRHPPVPPEDPYKWHGLTAEVVPGPSSPWEASVPGDPTSTRCAHTFYLTVWDRVINGYGHIHRSRYHKSITIYLQYPYEERICISAISKDLRGEFVVIEQEEQECESPPCVTLKARLKIEAEVTPHDPCDAMASRAFDGTIGGELVFAHIENGEGRGYHLGRFEWAGADSALIGRMSGVTNAGTHRSPAAPCEACDRRGHMEGRLDAVVVDGEHQGCRVLATYVMDYDTSHRAQDTAIIGTLEGVLICPCEG